MWEQSAEFISSAFSAVSLRHDLFFLFLNSFFHLFLFLFYPSSPSLSNLPSYQAISFSSNCEYVDFWWWLYFSFGFCWLKVFWAWSKNTLVILTITTLIKFFFFEFTLCKNLLFLPSQMNMQVIYLHLGFLRWGRPGCGLWGLPALPEL